MDEEHHKTIVTAAITAGVIGMVMGIARGIVQQKHGGWGPFFRGLVASIAAAILVGWGLADFDMSPTKQAFVIGVCAYLADDVLTGLQEIAKLFSADPFGTFEKVWSALRGRGKE